MLNQTKNIIQKHAKRQVNKTTLIIVMHVAEVLTMICIAVLTYLCFSLI